jgi:hypothetical protein
MRRTLSYQPHEPHPQSLSKDNLLENIRQM